MSEAKKAYELKRLKEIALKNGMPEVEQLAEKIYKSVKEWVVESAPISETKLDDAAPMLFPLLDKVVDPVLDGIADDGQ